MSVNMTLLEMILKRNEEIKKEKQTDEIDMNGNSRYSFIKSIRDSKGNLKGIIVEKKQ